MLIYLASPYSHPDKRVMEKRFKQVCMIAGRLFQAKYLLFCPIAQNHSIAHLCDLPVGIQFWGDFDRTMLDCCDELWVCTMDGWKESIGVQHEIAYMRHKGKPVFTLEPDTLEKIPLSL